jgi:hypothetical protein
LPLSAKIAEIRDHNIDPLDYMGEDYVRKEEREKIREIEKRRTIDRERERKRMNMWTKKKKCDKKVFSAHPMPNDSSRSCQIFLGPTYQNMGK